MNFTLIQAVSLPLMLLLLEGGFELMRNIVLSHNNRLSTSVSKAVGALLDSSCHASVGALSWAIAADLRPTRVFVLESVMYTALLASLVDLDHFIMARSFSLEAALTLSHRPPLHCSAIIPPAMLVLWLLQFLFDQASVPLPQGLYYMLLVAWTTHHLRDGLRRGLWLWPWPSISTPPLSITVYVLAVCGVSWTARGIMYWTKFSANSRKTDANTLPV